MTGGHIEFSGHRRVICAWRAGTVGCRRAVNQRALPAPWALAFVHPSNVLMQRIHEVDAPK